MKQTEMKEKVRRGVPQKKDWKEEYLRKKKWKEKYSWKKK